VDKAEKVMYAVLDEFLISIIIHRAQGRAVSDRSAEKKSLDDGMEVT
jgi:hypothetical protein